MATRLGSAMLGAALCLAACGDDDLDSEHGDGSVARDAGDRDATASDGSDALLDSGGAALDGALAGDAATIMHDGSIGRPLATNVSFETAMRIEPDGPPLLQDEISADQIDYFVFAGEEGEFFELSTDRQTFSPDVVLSLYDADHELIAQNDEGAFWPGAPLDARLVVRLPQSGDYYVTVDDPYTPAQFFDSQLPLLYYHLRLRALVDGVEGFALAHAHAAEPQSVVFATDAKTGYGYVTLLGTLGADSANSGGFDVPGLAAQALIGKVQLSGSLGNGSTVAGGLVRVADSEEHALAQIDRSQGQDAFDPPVEAASYRLTVSEDLAGGELGENPFYVLDLVMLEDNPREQSEADNGELAGAEAVELQGMLSRRGLLLASLPEADVDYFKVDAMEGETIAAVCEGESGGSGVRGLVAELRDDADEVLGTATESTAENLKIAPIAVTRTATYYLRLSSATPKAGDDAIDPWARCAVYTGF